MSSASRSIYPTMWVIGVRSSCEMFATKSAFSWLSSESRSSACESSTVRSRTRVLQAAVGSLQRLLQLDDHCWRSPGPAPPGVQHAHRDKDLPERGAVRLAIALVGALGLASACCKLLRR